MTIALRIVAGRMAGRSRGTVMRLNWLQAGAPSTAAASYSSLGMLCSAPRMTIMKNGYDIQTLAMTIEAKAHVGSLSHGSPACGPATTR